MMQVTPIRLYSIVVVAAHKILCNQSPSLGNLLVRGSFCFSLSLDFHPTELSMDARNVYLQPGYPLSTVRERVWHSTHSSAQGETTLILSFPFTNEECQRNAK